MSPLAVEQLCGTPKPGGDAVCENALDDAPVGVEVQIQFNSNRFNTYLAGCRSHSPSENPLIPVLIVG